MERLQAGEPPEPSSVKGYAEDYWQHRLELGERPRPELATLIKRRVAYRAGPVLDVGCVPGTHLQMFRKWFPAELIVGLDAAEGQLRAARLPNVLVADARRPPFDRTFKLVYAINSPCFWPASPVYDPEFLRKLVSLLDPPAELAILHPAFHGNVLKYLDAGSVAVGMRDASAARVTQHFFVRPLQRVPVRPFLPFVRVGLRSSAVRALQDTGAQVYALTVGLWEAR